MQRMHEILLQENSLGTKKLDTRVKYARSNRQMHHKRLITSSTMGVKIKQPGIQFSKLLNEKTATFH